jgi:hypothetical protein
MAEHRSLLPPRNEICQRLTEVNREKRLLENLLKLSVREEQDRREYAQRQRQQGGADNG